MGIGNVWSESQRENRKSDESEEKGEFLILYARFVLEALDRGIAGGWRSEVR